MEKRGKLILFVVLISFLFVTLPFVSAQSYSGFNRFTDNVKFFFSSGENKVNLALEIREKEINSALENLEDKGEVTKNLERARNKLLIVQEKVSVNNAEKVKANVNEIIDKVNNYENISSEFETYILEEEKTQLTAELIVEIEGKEGKILTREVVKDGTTGQNKVKIVIEGDKREQKIIEIEGKIAQIENQIAERVVKMDIAGKIDKSDLENGIYIAKGEGNGDDGLKPEIKNDLEEGTIKNEPLPEPDLNKINPDLYNPNARAPSDTIDETYDDDLVNQGDCGDGVDCGDGSAESGTEGTNDVVPAIDSDEGDSSGVITGDVIALEGKQSFLGKLFRKIFGI